MTEKKGNTPILDFLKKIIKFFMGKKSNKE
jgi:hypothetical protein